MVFSKLASGLTNALTGGLADTLFDAIKTYFPPEMPLEEKGKLMLQLQRLELEKKQQADEVLLDAERELTQRISQLEGTAKDLKTIPYLGGLVIFMRGCQRPIWGFFTLWLDYQWFSHWTLSSHQQQALIAINLLVLGFLFGERAAKNIAPWIIQAIQAKR